MTEGRYRDGAKRIAPIALAALAFSVSFGVLARASGIGALEAIVMSMTVFAGSAQFAVVSILAVGGGIASAILAAVLLNARYDRRLLVGAGLVLYACWVGGTIVGALAGEALGDPADLGLDAAFPALFLAILVTQVHSRRALAAAVLGGTIALVLIPVAPAGVPIVAAAAACLIGWRRP